MFSKDSSPAGSSPNDPNPSSGGNEPSGYSTPEGHSPSHGDQAASTNQRNSIWDNVEDIKKHPLVYTGVLLAKEGIENCNSKSFDTLDSKDSKDHKDALLSFPGKFTVDKLEDDVYATYRSGVGIIFNGSFANRSTNAAKHASAWEDHPTESIVDNQQNVRNFIAFMQELVEHELGHVNYHWDGAKDDNSGEPDPKNKLLTPRRLRFEAGFEAQKNIRMNNFPKESVREATCRILEPHPTRSQDFVLNLTFQYLSENPTDELDQFEEEDNIKVGKDELLKHMAYPKAGACDGKKQNDGKKRKRDGGDFSHNPPDDGPSPDKGGDGDGDADKRPSSERNGRSWVESVEHFLPIAMAAFESTIEIQRETSFDWKDPLLRTVLRRWWQGQTFEKCDIELMTCDKHRKKKSRFGPQDNIYVKLSIYNKSKQDVFVGIAPGSAFGRRGLQVHIAGVTPEPLVESPRPFGLKIPPSESYTIVRILAKPNAEKRDVGYTTPIPGQYEASVPSFSKYHGRIPTCSFSVVGNRKSTRRKFTRKSF